MAWSDNKHRFNTRNYAGPEFDQFRNRKTTRKVRDLVIQAQNAYQRTLNALAKLWLEKSRDWASMGMPPLPDQVVCHCVGDGAVDLWVRAIYQMKEDLAAARDGTGFWNPTFGIDIPKHWELAFSGTENVDPSQVQQFFYNERFRVEHLLNVSSNAIKYIRKSKVVLILPDETRITTPSIDYGTSNEERIRAEARNVVFSTQPVLITLSGADQKQGIFRAETWPILHECNALGYPSGTAWGYPPIPRMDHAMPTKVFLDTDVPFTLNTDPPSVRDPRPALTIIGAVARTQIDFDPDNWVGKEENPSQPPIPPPDYLASAVLVGLGSMGNENQMQISVEQSLCAMTFWAAYVSKQERELGAIAQPLGNEFPGWYADLVIWKANPLSYNDALQGLGYPQSLPESGLERGLRVGVINNFVKNFLPILTVVGGKIVYSKMPSGV